MASNAGLPGVVPKRAESAEEAPGWSRRGRARWTEWAGRAWLIRQDDRSVIGKPILVPAHRIFSCGHKKKLSLGMWQKQKVNIGFCIYPL